MLNNIKLIFLDHNLLIWFSNDNKIYKEHFPLENTKEALLKYLNLIFKEPQDNLSNAFLNSLHKMQNRNFAVMTIYNNKTWYKSINKDEFEKIEKAFLNTKTSDILIKEILKEKSIENNFVLKDLENSIKAKPDDDYLIFKYAIALAELGKLEDAIDSFREAISINDDNPDYFYYLSLTYRKLNKLNLAIVEMSTAIIKEPDNYLYLRNLAEMYYESERYKDSLDIYLNIYYILGTDPEDIYEIQLRLGDIYNKLEYYEDAILLYEEILSIDKNNKQAEIGLEKALNIKKRITSADINNLGIAYAEKNKYDKAIEKFKKAIEINSSDPEFYYNLAVAYKKNNMLIQAIIEFKNVLKCDSKIYDVHFELGEIYQKQNNINMAVEEYNKFIKYSNDLHKIDETKKILDSLKIS